CFFSKMENKVLEYKKYLEKYPNGDKVMRVLEKLKKMELPIKVLQATSIGKTLNSFRKRDGEIGLKAKVIVAAWKEMVCREEAARIEAKIKKSQSKTKRDSEKQHKSSKHKQRERFTHDDVTPEVDERRVKTEPETNGYEPRNANLSIKQENDSSALTIKSEPKDETYPVSLQPTIVKQEKVDTEDKTTINDSIQIKKEKIDKGWQNDSTKTIASTSHQKLQHSDTKKVQRTPKKSKTINPYSQTSFDDYCKQSFEQEFNAFISEEALDAEQNSTEQFFSPRYCDQTASDNRSPYTSLNERDNDLTSRRDHTSSNKADDISNYSDENDYNSASESEQISGSRSEGQSGNSDVKSNSKNRTEFASLKDDEKNKYESSSHDKHKSSSYDKHKSSSKGDHKSSSHGERKSSSKSDHKSSS
ncbi:unnamed protein product, partial [Owenia fusiformis]